MTQEQRFDPQGRIGDYELRRYHPCVVAEVSVSSDFQSAGSAGFQALFNYIAGSNHARTKVAMTSPVLQEPGIKIDVTEPPIESDANTVHKVGFVMPGQFTHIDELPAPNDPRVSLRAVAEELVVVDRFSGKWTNQVYHQRLNTLLAVVQAAGYVTTGNPRFARFDPPWTPRFMRRNEIQIPVRKNMTASKQM